MSTTQTSSDTKTETRPGLVDMKLEVVVLPVADVDRAKAFYGSLGWRLDADFALSDDFRVVQFTPPGSGASVIFGEGVTSAVPGSVDGLQLTVVDIDEARADLVERGVDVSEVFHDAGGVFHHAGSRDRVAGPDPDRGSYGSFASFSDPDGNSWFLQEVTQRAPGREWDRQPVEQRGSVMQTTYESVSDVAEALRRAAAAHGEHEARTGQPDANWPDWYAEYMVRERAGDELPV